MQKLVSLQYLEEQNKQLREHLCKQLG